MKLVRTIRGYRPLTFVPDGILLAKGYDLYVADLDCTRLDRIAAVPHSWTSGAARRCRLVERTLRLGIRFACRVSEQGYLLAEGKRIWTLDLASRNVRLDHVVARSRPLSIGRIEGIEGFEDCTCYGEYWENERKEAVNIWMRDRDGGWRVGYTFPQGSIEHVHALIADKARGLVWILTSDFGEAAGIWAARNNFTEVSPVLVGKQQFRCCWLAFWDEQVLYATDSPLEPNSIRELIVPEGKPGADVSWTDVRSGHLADISGSSIYACTVHDQLVFSTAIEPGLLSGRCLHDLLDRRLGPGRRGPCSDLVIGDPTRGFVTAERWKKDWLPGRLCEFGSIAFPSGANPGSRIYTYFTALSGQDGNMCVFEHP